ncbi:MAG TPA: 3-deoxy-D-manno-octulosonic acid transferase [Desulfomonilia bacterium]
MARLILLIYRILAWIALIPLCVAVRNHPNFKGTIASRLGAEMPPAPGERKLIWLHCASLGEVKAAELLIDALKKVRPDILIYVSSMTVTGRDAACKIKGIDHVFPFPFDLAPVIRLFLKHLMPSALVIMETEIWPNLLNEARNKNVPVVFVNARMSGKSVRNFKIIKPLTSVILKNATVLAISDADAERFASIGAGHVKVIGNIKFDAVKSADTSKRKKLKESINADGRPVFIAGSVREGEERFVVDAVRYASSKIPGLISIVAPRHSGSVGLLGEMLNASGISFALRSSGNTADIIIVDTMGELFNLYGASDVAFVGGSLVDLGGQNILEPIAWGVPTIHGQYMSNFRWALDVVSGSTVEIDNPDKLGTAIIDVLGNPSIFKAKADEALHLISKLRGISMKYAENIALSLNK